MDLFEKFGILTPHMEKYHEEPSTATFVEEHSKEHGSKTSLIDAVEKMFNDPGFRSGQLHFESIINLVTFCIDEEDDDYTIEEREDHETLTCLLEREMDFMDDRELSGILSNEYLLPLSAGLINKHSFEILNETDQQMFLQAWDVETIDDLIEAQTAALKEAGLL